MMLILGWLLIGITAGVAFGSFIAPKGVGTPLIWNVGSGAIGGIIGGLVFGMISPMMFGPGPELLTSGVGAAIGAVAAALIVRVIRK